MGSSSLHHNSLVSNYKRSKKIDSDNAKIHFRITKTKSLYSQYWNFYSAFFPRKWPGWILNKLGIAIGIARSGKVNE